MTPSRWNDTFLDSLRLQGDPLADACLQRIVKDDEINGIKTLFSTMDSNDATPPEKFFPQLADFFAATHELPPGVDLDRVHRGEDVFMGQVFEGALVLLTKSLPEGYAAPNLSIILNISGDLRTHTYKRLLGTLQMLINVSACRGFQAGGRAVIVAQKLRLLHAGIRHLTRRYRPGFEAKYGVPVNHEDMLGTIMGFSYLVIMGWRRLEIGLTREQEEDFFYLWRVFAHMMGIYPAGKPESADYLPETVDDAGRFYEAYKRRHYVRAAENPDGVALGEANLEMLQNMIPRVLRFLGFGLLPRLYMDELMGPEACERISIRPVPGRTILKWILLHIHRLWSVFEHYDRTDHERIGQMIFQGMINRAYDGQVTFTIPDSLKDLQGMVDSRDGKAAGSRSM
jgi:hypothetical protein